MDAKSLCDKLLLADTEDTVVKTLKDAGYWDDVTAWRSYGDLDNNYGTIGNQQSEAIRKPQPASRRIRPSIRPKRPGISTSTWKLNIGGPTLNRQSNPTVQRYHRSAARCAANRGSMPRGGQGQGISDSFSWKRTALCSALDFDH